MIVSFGELAKAIGKSEPTLRKLVDLHADFPVESRGTNGVAYQFDLEKVADFLNAIKARAEAEEIARQKDIQQLALELLGEGAAVADRDIGLTAQDRKNLMEEETAAIKLGILRSEYIKKDSVEEAFGSVLVWFCEKGKSFSSRLARRHDISRDLITAIDELIEADQREMADRMARAGDLSLADIECGEIERVSGGDQASSTV